MPLPESCEFEVPALIRIFGPNEAPPFVLNAPQNCASVLGRPSVSPEPPVPRSLRASYQTVARLPVVWSSAILGRNWLFTVLSLLTRTPELQVDPLSSENCTKMSVLSLSF